MLAGLFDYGVGNLHSLNKALEYVGIKTRIIDKPKSLLKSDVLILPGVGAFGPASVKLSRVRPDLKKMLRTGAPCLAICLGMQLLYEESEEARGKGIGLLPGSVKKLEHKILPHMGWNQVSHKGQALFKGIANRSSFYFAHTFAASSCTDFCISETKHGRNFASAINAFNVWGTQFHPEKSSTNGIILLNNFSEILKRI